MLSIPVLAFSFILPRASTLEILVAVFKVLISCMLRCIDFAGSYSKGSVVLVANG